MKRQQQNIFCAKAKRQQQDVFCAKAKRQVQMSFVSKAKRQIQMSPATLWVMNTGLSHFFSRCSNIRCNK
ncbi:hypothetical protein [Lysinibacillus sp. NPDC056232]|uniref:hypothetical protein n=1 Tax=Lysinibacillus sp. NPDC056232 TaxID=3345756 RepID=UPI0035DFB661